MATGSLVLSPVGSSIQLAGSEEAGAGAPPWDRSDVSGAPAPPAESALQKFVSTVSIAENTRRAAQMFKKKITQPGLDAIMPIAPVLPPPSPAVGPSYESIAEVPPSSSNVSPSDVSKWVSTADFKAGDYVQCRRMVEIHDLQYQVGQKALYEGEKSDLGGGRSFAPTYAGVIVSIDGDGLVSSKSTYTLERAMGDMARAATPHVVTRNIKPYLNESSHHRIVKRVFDDTLYSAMVAKLSDVFKEADADNDGKLTYDEWESRMGKLVPADELKRLFEECDTDKNGSLDMKEFATGMASKYEIQWAQV